MVAGFPLFGTVSLKSSSIEEIMTFGEVNRVQFCDLPDDQSFTVREETPRMLVLVRRMLLWGVVLALLLPVVLMLLLGLGGLLGGMGDTVGRSLCVRFGLLIGLGWAVAVVITAVAGGLLLLESGGNGESGGSGESRSRRPETVHEDSRVA
jgi:hypothetical protein